jgi:hypothetical protein
MNRAHLNSYRSSRKLTFLFMSCSTTPTIPTIPTIPTTYTTALVIATCASQSHTSNRQWAPYVLDLQFRELSKVIAHPDCPLTHIIVMIPMCTDPIPTYYQPEKWETHLPITYIEYVGDNQHHSYDQWLQVYCTLPEFDYYIFIEDDYYLDASTPNVIGRLLEIYQHQFPDQLGYLCSMHIDLPPYGSHAAISNGVCSRATLQVLQDPCQQYYSITESDNPQTMFSILWVQHHVPIRDYRSYHLVWFYASNHQALIDYSTHPQSLTHLFRPVHDLIVPYLPFIHPLIQETKISSS